ncbi:MAG: response regulator, partial [Anaerolineales bacterium]|nr:response regulator [Anaerolineales bacterium]
DRERAHQLGADGYLVKFFTLDELRHTLSRIPKPGKPQNEPIPAASNETTLGTIMIADDNETNVLMIEDYLRAQKYRVYSCFNGAEFLANVNEVRPDLVIMDIQMPNMDGLETTQILRRLPDPKIASVPVIAITALAMPGDRERCLDAGANEYLSKPIRLKELISLIQQMLKG